MDSSALSVHPQHALTVYAEPWVAAARVAVFGDASLGLGARLIELGAHTVDLWDPDPSRAARVAKEAPRGVTVRPYAASDVDTRSVDLVLVADLGVFPDVPGLVRRVRRALGSEGVAMIAAKSAEVVHAGEPGAFDYYDLFDLVSPEFERVRMIAQLPFHGLALVELGGEDESPAVSVDTQLVDSGRLPEAFLVVASQQPVRLEPYAIVQLPSPVEGVSMDRDALARADLRSELLASQLDDLRARLSESAVAADGIVELEQTLRSRSGQVVELEKALSVGGHELASLSNQVEALRAAAEAGANASAEIGEVTRRADRAEQRVVALEGQIMVLAEELAAGVEERSEELAGLEEVIQERARALRLLEGELTRRDQMIRDLLDTIEELQATPALPPVAEANAAPPESPLSTQLADENARLCQQLDALAMDLARREGDAHASGWRIAELELRLAEATHAAPVSHESNAPGAVLEELDALRKALTQEHEARMRAQSGQELAQARAEIERQAVLLEQLGREGRAENREKASKPHAGMESTESAMPSPGTARTRPTEDSR